MSPRRKRPPAYVLGSVPAVSSSTAAGPPHLPAVKHADGRCLAQAYPSGEWHPADPAAFTPTPTPEETR